MLTKFEGKKLAKQFEFLLARSIALFKLPFQN